MPATDAATEPLRAARRVLQLGAVLVVLVAIAGPLHDLDRYQVPKELVLHLCAFGAAFLALRQARRLPLATVDLLLIGYGCLALLSALVADNGWLAFRAAGLTWAGLGLFWTARALARAGLTRPLLGVVAAAAVLGAVTGLLQAYGAELPLESARRTPGGTFGNRNFMAHLTALAVPLVVFLTLDSRARFAPLLGGTAMLLSAAALLLSRSRAAWLAVAAGIVFLLIEGVWVSGLRRDPRIRRRLAALGAAGVLGAGAALAVPNALEWRSGSPYLESLIGVANFREGSGRGRLIQYANTLRMAADNPLLGVGPGNWPVEYPRYTTPGDPAFDPDDPIPTNPWPSSDWIALLAERGVPALALLWGAAGVMTFLGWRRSRERGRATEGLAGLTLVATIVVMAVVGSFDAVSLLPAPAFFAWTVLGALLPPPRQVASMPRALSVRALTVVVALAGSAFAFRSAAQSASIILAGDGSSVRALRWAARLDPGSYRLQMILAVRRDGRTRCERAREHGVRAGELFPHHPAPKAVLRGCRQ
jgi:O-antigen ligase